MISIALIELRLNEFGILSNDMRRRENSRITDPRAAVWISLQRSVLASQTVLKTRGKPGASMTRRDKYQRQTYAMRRVSAAVARLVHATTPGEKAQAAKWARLWTKAAKTAVWCDARKVKPR